MYTVQRFADACLFLPYLTDPAADAQIELLLSWMTSVPTESMDLDCMGGSSGWEVHASTAWQMLLHSLITNDARLGAARTCPTPGERGLSLSAVLLARAVQQHHTSADRLHDLRYAVSEVVERACTLKMLSEAGLAAWKQGAPSPCPLAALLGVMLGSASASRPLVSERTAFLSNAFSQDSGWGSGAGT
jgi:hypothetical protein